MGICNGQAMHTPLIWVSLNLIAIWKEMAMNYTHILQFYMPDWSSLLSWKMISITSLLDSGRSNVRKSHCDFKLDCYLNHSLHERDLQWMEKFSSPCIPRQEENHLPSGPLSKPKVNCNIQFNFIMEHNKLWSNIIELFFVILNTN